MSLEADHILRKLQQLPITQALKKGAVPLPEVRAPSLDGLKMTVELPPPPTEDELAGRFVELLRECGARRERAPGEAVARGDELRVDLFVYVDGKLAPGGVKLDFVLDLVEDPSFPGLVEQVAGAPVGSAARASVVLGATHPNAELRGARAELLIEILRAFEVTPVDGENEAALQALERGSTLDQVMESIATELMQLALGGAWADAEQDVLDEVASRAGVEVSDALIDEELRRRWATAEGTQLSAKGFDAQEQAEALELWLGNPVAREEARRVLRVSLALKAIAERDGVQPDPAQLEAIMLAAAEPFGLDAAALKEVGKADPTIARALTEAAWQQQLASYVIERAEVREVQSAS